MTARRKDHRQGRSWLNGLITFATPPVAEGHASDLNSGLGWNLVGFSVIASAGLLLNIAVAGFYDAEILGLFNIVLAIYIVGGQLAAFGIQYSTLYHVSVLIEEPEEIAAATQAAICGVATLSISVCAIIWLSNSAFINNPMLAKALVYALPGQFLFPLNKIMMAALNGRRRMGAFALFNAGRVVLIVAAVVLAGFLGVTGERLSASLSVAELILFVGLFASSHAVLHPALSTQRLRHWLREHFRFGAHGVLGGLFAELNSRVDVLVLGLFASSSAVGVYSVGAIFAEGLVQLLLVLRINLDPLLAKLIAEGRMTELRHLIRWAKAFGYAAMALTGVAAILIYPLIVPIVFDWGAFGDSWLIFTILTCGLMLSAGFLPLGGILQQSRNPLAQTAFSGTMVCLNIIGNFVLSPLFGMIGAACGTALAQLLFPFVLIRYTQTKLKLTI